MTERDASPKDQVTTVLQAAVGGTSLAAGLVFVFINAAYIHFYEEFGVQPEQVGLNRLNILARTGGIVLAIMIVVFCAGSLAVRFPSGRRTSLTAFSACALAFAFAAYRSFEWAYPWAILNDPPAILPKAGVGLFLGTFALGFWLVGSTRETWRDRRYQDVAPRVVAERKRNFWFRSAVGLFAIVMAMALVEFGAVQARQESVLAGKNVKAATILEYPFLDVKARYARVLQSDVKPDVQARLQDPWLLYLGRNSDSAVFVSCGSAITLSAANLAFETTNKDEPYGGDKDKLTGSGRNAEQARDRYRRFCDSR
ncbi:hypothetical protein [Yinghuangia sp. YIM S10712]|uniref:hypothetical protein n=1 Tax=Yinghuangia sp. YIM S10712 TaxID=3436930 RepID=UPI003F5333AC